MLEANLKQMAEDSVLQPWLSEDWVVTLVQRDSHARSTILAVEKLIAGTSSSAKAAYIANLLITLNVDVSVVLAGAIYFGVKGKEFDLNNVEHVEIENLVTSLVRMSQTDDVAETSAPFLERQSRNHRKNVRQLLIALIDDPRVAVLKLAERMVVLHFDEDLAPDQVKKIANEVLDFYCPLASRLGIWQLKWMLEDVAFAHLKPQEFRAIVSVLNERREQREKQIEAVCEDLQWRLGHEGIESKVTGRAKNVYGIWLKMQEKNISFDAVYDVEAVRVIVNTVPNCYAVLGVVHTSWPSIPEAFDDYIANPKANGYCSIHTAVIGPRGRNLEVQIRTQKMHAESELGVCAHWAYKDDDDTLKNSKVDWMREVLNWQEDMHDGAALIDFTRSSHELSRIYVSTPKGHVIDLPAGSTAVDFAYRIHTDIGNHCYGVNVNGVPRPLNRPLETGQVVEILTSPDAIPQRAWLDPELGYARTTRVRKSIQSFFREEQYEDNVEAGKAWLEEECRRLEIDLDAEELAVQNNYSTVDQFYIAISVGDQRIQDLLTMENLDEPRVEELLKSEGEDDEPRAVQEVEVRAKDRPGLLLDVTSTLVSMSINVLGARIDSPIPGKTAILRIKLEAEGLSQTRKIITQLRALQDVIDVTRTSETSISNQDSTNP